MFLSWHAQVLGLLLLALVHCDSTSMVCDSTSMVQRNLQRRGKEQHAKATNQQFCANMLNFLNRCGGLIVKITLQEVFWCLLQNLICPFFAGTRFTHLSPLQIHKCKGRGVTMKIIRIPLKINWRDVSVSYKIQNHQAILNPFHPTPFV